jgi:hypothetical protein
MRIKGGMLSIISLTVTPRPMGERGSRPLDGLER